MFRHWCVVLLGTVILLAVCTDVSKAQNPDVSKAQNLPVGAILAFAGPLNDNLVAKLENEGWLPCDGREVDKQSYPELFDTIGVYWGVGDKLNTFNLPDLNGVYLVGATPIIIKSDYKGDDKIDVGQGKGDKSHSHTVKATKAKVSACGERCKGWTAASATEVPENGELASSSYTPRVSIVGKVDEASQLPPSKAVTYIIRVK